MKYNDVLIRKKTNVDLLDPIIIKAFLGLSKKTTIPIYYQFLQPKVQKSLIDDNASCIGIANNIRVNEFGDIVCTVVTNDAVAVTENFSGVIDNFIIEVDPKTNLGVLKQLVIYNKEEKKKIDAMRAERASQYPKPGVSAIPNNVPKEALDAVIKDIKEEFDGE